jgi:Response regulator
MNPTIFVVDDEPDVRNAVAFALRQSGHTVRTFASGHELLNEVDSLLPELRAVFVLDVRMEPMSGPALHDALIARGLRERAPVLFLSGQGDIPLVVAAMSKGSLDFVEKPHIDRLVGKVTSALAQEAEWFDTSRRAAFRLSLWVSLSPQQKRVACRVAQRQAEQSDCPRLARRGTHDRRAPAQGLRQAGCPFSCRPGNDAG